jgi:DNA polymerase III subunit gamma/tau
MVYYRKYRPQSLDELIGQQVVKETLLKAFQADKLSHAYLFCGPRGTGKTSTARILAKLVNCEASSPVIASPEGAKQSDEGKEIASGYSPRNDEVTIPCNKCSSCVSITDGSNLDLVEIDAASNRGIDDIRELRERVKLSPTSAKKKVYIIDEVHMLTNEAFNALLKTLEEPPQHVLFILATTELTKIPQTILSRVQKLDFKLANNQDLVEALKKVAVGEKVEIEESALNLIAKRAEGSFRDGLKLLDQLASSGEKITLEIAENSLRSSKFEDVIGLLKAINKKDANQALQLISKQNEQGVNIKEFLCEVIDTLRNILFINNGAEVAAKNNLGEGKFERIKELAVVTPKGGEILYLELFQRALEQLKFTSIPSLPLEIAVVEATQELREEKAETVLKGNSETIKLTQAIRHSELVSEASKEIRNQVQGDANLVDSGVIPQSGISQNDNPTDDVMSQDLAILKDKWQFVLETIKPYNFSLEALLKQAKLLSCNEGLIMLEVPYSFHQRILEAPKSRDLLESVLTDVLGKTARVSCVLGKRPVRVEEIANVELAQDDEIIKVAADIFNSES